MEIAFIPTLNLTKVLLNIPVVRIHLSPIREVAIHDKINKHFFDIILLVGCRRHLPQFYPKSYLHFNIKCLTFLYAHIAHIINIT